MLRHFTLLILLFATGCSGGAVVFAPPPAPPDVSPLLYTHPAGVFSAAVPRNWGLYEQNTTVVASAAFSAPSDEQPSVTFAVVNVGEVFDSAAFASFLDRYQTQIRPDVTYYTEVNRQAMGDGSWRLSGIRQSAGGIAQQVNTFVQQTSTFVSVIDVMVSADAPRMSALQQIINTFTVNTTATLEASDPNVLSYATTTAIEFLHVTTWRTQQNVFFITGEVANRGSVQLTDIPVRAVLKNADGIPIAEAVDTVMGYSLPVGGFAPFSLRFGQGQPAFTTTFDLSVGNAGWQSEPERVVYGQDELAWQDASSFDANGTMIIEGAVQNISDKPLIAPRVVATVFDAAGNVIAAGYVDLTAALNKNDSAPFRILVPEMGGDPANYIINVQALP